MKGDWVVGADFNCAEKFPVSNLCDAENFTAPFSASLIDSQDLSDKEDSLTVVRIVGDIPSWVVWKQTLVNIGFTGFNITMREGIYLAGSDGSLPTGNVDELDPRLPGDFQLDTWLWMRTRTFKFAVLNPTTAPVGAFFWQAGSDYAGAPGSVNDHIDLRVKRRLKRGQELVYVCGGFHQPMEDASGSFALGPDPADLTGLLQMHLRCYCKF